MIPSTPHSISARIRASASTVQVYSLRPRSCAALHTSAVTMSQRVDRMRAHRNRVHHQVNRLLVGQQGDANVEMKLLNLFQIFPIEARHDAVAERIARLHDLRDLMLDAGGFELDIQSALAAGKREHLVEGGNSLTLDRAAFELRAGVQALELLEGQLRDFALAVGRALDGLVMNDDDAAVATELHVELTHLRTRVDSGAKSAQGVLGKSTARPAMGYVQHSPPPPRWKNRNLIMTEFTRSSSAGANPPGVTVNNTRAEWARKNCARMPDSSLETTCTQNEQLLLMKKILILGVNGFIGHHLTKRIIETTDWQVYGMDMNTDRVSEWLDHQR